MILGRREFLELFGLAAGGAAFGGLGRLWEVPDEAYKRALRGPGQEAFANSVCGLCGAGCGVRVRLIDGLPVGLKGNPGHPLNRGGLCPVGQAGLEVLYAPERLKAPLRRDGKDRLQPVSWDEAFADIATRLSDLRSSGNEQRIAVLNGEPSQLFRDLARRFTHSLGSSNFATMTAPRSTAYRLAQGIEHLPGFDLNNADLVVSFGLDLYEDGAAPVHAIAALIGSRTGDAGAELIHVGTRLSPTATKAKMRIPIKPGSYGAFALGVAHVLVREGSFDKEFVSEHTFGFDDWIDENGRRRLGFRRLLLERFYPDRAGRLCGCAAERIVEAARRLASASAPVALAGGEATEGTNATWTVLAVHALNALLGRFDRAGGVLLPAGIPLASMPSENGGAHAGDSIFVRSPAAGTFEVDPLATLADRLVDDPSTLEAVFVIGDDPLSGSPAGGRLREALAKVPLVVALTPFDNATAAIADYVLPIHVPLEAWQGVGTPTTVGFSVLGIGHPVVEPLHDTRHAGDILLELSQRLKASLGDDPPWADYRDYLEFRIAGLAATGQGSVVAGSFEESWIHFLEERGWRFQQNGDPESLWKDLVREGAWWDPVHSAGDWTRIFPTASGRYEFFSRSLEKSLIELGLVEEEIDSDERALERGIAALGLAAKGDEACLPHYEPPRWSGEGDLTLVPFRPLTSRGPFASTSPMVLEMYGYAVMTGWKTWAEVAPATAAALHLRDGDRVEIKSDRGSLEAVLRVQAGAVPGVVHVPLGLNRQSGNGADKGVVDNPIGILAETRDDLSGAFSLASTRVRMRLIERRRHGGPAPRQEVHS